jgi:hypothetical protein
MSVAASRPQVVVMPRIRRTAAALVLAVLGLPQGYVVAAAAGTAKAAGDEGLVGAWSSRVQFKKGGFAAISDLTFLYAFNLGGTMTESSNYDGAPPVPPAYGVWRKIGPNRYEAKYVFFASKAPRTFEDLGSGGGWLPAGRGILTESITLSRDGNAFTSLLRLDLMDGTGKLTDSSEAEGRGVRIQF